MRVVLCPLIASLAALLPVVGAFGQVQEFELTPEGRFESTRDFDPTADEAVIAEARRLLAIEDESGAIKVLRPWIKANERTTNPLLPEAYLIRAEARIASGGEYRALFDLEAIARDFPESPQFPEAIRLEYEIGKAYLDGLKKKLFGLFRIEPSASIGEELLIRVQERLPGSELAEQAAIDLADFYYRIRKLAQASEMYEIFVVNHPDSGEVRRARLRRILAEVADFKGPDYNAAGLIEADLLIDDYVNRYPAEAFRSGITAGLEERIDESLALQRLDTARWYMRRSDKPSARFVLRRLLREHPETTAAQEALRIMEREGWIEEAPEAVPEGPGNPESQDEAGSESDG